MNKELRLELVHDLSQEIKLNQILFYKLIIELQWNLYQNLNPNLHQDLDEELHQELDEEIKIITNE